MKSQASSTEDDHGYHPATRLGNTVLSTLHPGTYAKRLPILSFPGQPSSSEILRKRDILVTGIHRLLCVQDLALLSWMQVDKRFWMLIGSILMTNVMGNFLYTFFQQDSFSYLRSPQQRRPSDRQTTSLS